MQIIRSLDELEAKITECNVALAVEGDDAMRRLFSTFEMDFSRDLPGDPFEAAYRDFQLSVYRRVAGRDYVISNERTWSEPTEPISNPFPFNTGSCATAGNHFLAIGVLLRALDLAPGARVLEFGPGWGHTTLALARLGMRVTAVDVEPNFCAHISAEAARNGVTIEVIEGDFFHAARVTEPYDAVVFFECFHHCDDHLRLLADLHGAVKPGGFVAFGAEPILVDYPFPWGVRVDGEALWAMHNFGWLELGFRESYFVEAMARTGWRGTKTTSADAPWISIWIARKADGGAAPVAVQAVVDLPPVDQSAIVARELASGKLR